MTPRMWSHGELLFEVFLENGKFQKKLNEDQSFDHKLNSKLLRITCVYNHLNLESWIMCKFLNLKNLYFNKIVLRSVFVFSNLK